MQQILTEWRKYLAEQAEPSPEVYKQVLKKHMESYTLFRALAQEGRVAEIKKYISEDAKNVLHKIVYPSQHPRGRIILPIKDRAYAAQLLSYYYADNSQIVKRYNKAYKQLLGLDAKLNEDMKNAIKDIGLDILGIVADPVFGAGAVFDAINMGRHIQAGNILWALMSAISIVPGVGDAIAKGFKWGLKGVLKLFEKAQLAAPLVQAGVLRADTALAAMGYEESEGIRQFTKPLGAATKSTFAKYLQDKALLALVNPKVKAYLGEKLLPGAVKEGIMDQKAANAMLAQFSELETLIKVVATAKPTKTA